MDARSMLYLIEGYSSDEDTEQQAVLVVNQKGRDQLFAKWLRGDRPKSKRIEYVKADRNILAVVEDENRNVMDYLRGIALNFVMGE
uniref:Uncharacterized protein n=1 Tax=Ditylenchus dipsaci TaxID=166011 RepID=A0A915D8P1_9BILA